MALRDPNDIEFDFRRDPRVGSSTISYRQRLAFLGPLDRDYGMRALLVAIVVAFVFIKIEASIGPRIYAKFDRVTGLLICILDLRTEREDRTRATEEGDEVGGSLNV